MEMLEQVSACFRTLVWRAEFMVYEQRPRALERRLERGESIQPSRLVKGLVEMQIHRRALS